MPRGPQRLKEEIELCDADGGNPHLFPLAKDRFGELLWSQGSVPAEDAEPGEELTVTWDYFGGGAGETYDLQELIGVKTGGYYFSDDCQVTNPYAIRPRQVVTTVTLTNNNTEVTQIFEAKSASDTKKLYAITDTKAYRLDISGTPTLRNTKDFRTPNVEFETGAYTSDGSTRGIICSFPIKALIIKAIDGAYAAAFKTADMSLGKYKESTGTFHETASAATGISFSGSRFLIGASGANSINHDGTLYAWMAFGGDYIVTGSFTGNATDRDIEETDFGQPHAVFFMTDNDNDCVVFKPADATGDVSWDLGAASTPTADLIEDTASWPTDGVNIGTHNYVNRSAATVYWVFLKEDTDVLKVASYSGDGVDPQNVTDPSFDPTYAVICCAEAASRPVIHRSDKCSGDSSMYFIGTANAADLVQGLITDGFQVGGSDHVNKNGETYYYMAVCPDPSHTVVCGQPAEWNSVWELPKGPDVNRAGLTTIVDGTGNDTWTTRSTGSPKADHLCVVENELVRASADRVIDKCSALDTDVDGNWTGDYNVGPPGTKITSLVNVSGEVGVGTTDGFYLFDLISQSRQQLPLLAGIADDENAKGTTVVGTMVLVPTVDGAWRVLSGSAAQFGLDANEFYAEVEGPSSIPIKLKYYGFAYCGTYVYEAVYDGTNYHIIYTRLNPRNPTIVGAKWDFLLTTTNKIKKPKVDSLRRLWFPYANNIAFIQLSRGGAPDGGSWGETSGTGNFYHPVTRMGTNAKKRFRLIEIEVDSTPSNYNWSASVYIDGGGVAGVGDAITADGVGECFWTAGTSDTGREILVRTNWATDSNYSVQSTPPEVKRVTLHADPLTEDADLIVCSIDLSVNAKEKKAIIDSKLNSAPIKLIDPLTGEKHTVVLYRRRVYQLRQEGNTPSKAACELRFRRSDVS